MRRRLRLAVWIAAAAVCGVAFGVLVWWAPAPAAGWRCAIAGGDFACAGTRPRPERRP